MKSIIFSSLIFITACSGIPVQVVSESSSQTSISQTTSPTATVTPTPQTRPTTTFPQDPEMNGYQPDVFISMIQSNIPYWYRSYSNETLLEIGHLFCQGLDSGTSLEYFFTQFFIRVNNQDPTLSEGSGLFARYSILYICPEYYYHIGSMSN
jgi:hypothetical protein